MLSRTTFSSEEDARDHFFNETAIVVKDSRVYVLIKMGYKYEVEMSFMRGTKQASEFAANKITVGNTEISITAYFNKFIGVVNVPINNDERYLNVYHNRTTIPTTETDDGRIDMFLINTFSPCGYMFIADWLSRKLKGNEVPNICISEYDMYFDNLLENLFGDQYVYISKEEHVELELQQIVDRRVVMIDDNLHIPNKRTTITEHIHDNRGYIIIRNNHMSFKVKENTRKLLVDREDINIFRNKLINMKNKYDYNYLWSMYFLSGVGKLSNYQSGTVYLAYKDWCNNNGMEATSGRAFSLHIGKLVDTVNKHIDGTNVTLFNIHKKVVL